MLIKVSHFAADAANFQPVYSLNYVMLSDWEYREVRLISSKCGEERLNKTGEIRDLYGVRQAAYGKRREVKVIGNFSFILFWHLEAHILFSKK